jgi:hypothetical protein
MHPAYFDTRFRCATVPDYWPDSFVIVSAYATTGTSWSSEHNLGADAALRRTIVERNLWLWRIEGYSPVTQHAEPSWATIMAPHEACDLGGLFLQDAIYWVEQDRLFVIQCSRPDRPVFVDMFSRRLDS